ncbi:hypothetical protein H632_c889p0 [Helicosporidium sp. ATCC 50920]|nr:hypothetical protein H632_c889p0 [Helicosporidium sp. ATCC 50920]|eukprot:KDD75072.1 hypothetical protein H632_c889p0 [Helicosporidium sp. ATCC 50920]
MASLASAPASTSGPSHALLGPTPSASTVSHHPHASPSSLGLPEPEPTLQPTRVVLLLLDGCLGVPSVPLHDLTWYALFSLLREIGTLRGSIGEFVDAVRAAGAPSAQLRLLNAYRPPELRGQEAAWDAAIYTTLDRAGLLKRLVRAQLPQQPPTRFDGPAALLVPKDRLGELFRDATSAYCADDLLHVPLRSRHTEGLLSERALVDTAHALHHALRVLFTRL